MISDNRSIQQLAALLVAHGVRDAVVCPGSRNAAISHTLARTEAIRCHAATDERSAGFQAMGMAVAAGHPVAVCVTSGSALLNLHPAVAEAYYQRVPLVVVSADRPGAWIGQQDGQTLPQPGVFGTLVRRSVNLPEIHTEEDEWYANRLINEALLETTRHGGGPVHINVPIAEPFYEFHTPELPRVRVIRRHTTLGTEWQTDLSRYAKRLVLIGQCPSPMQLPQGIAILSEHIGNQSTGIRGNLDGLIAAIPEGEEAKYRPDLLITIGGHIVAKRLKQFLRQNPPLRHVHVSPAGEVVDTFRCLTDVVACEGETFFLAAKPGGTRQTSDQNARQQAYAQLWEQLADSARKEGDREEPTAEARAVRLLISRLPKHAVLHLANSSAVRLAERFPMNTGIAVRCNRGVNGIEGSLSAAVGHALATPDRENFVIIGDLSFFYDQNALWHDRLPRNLHILLLNNGGGRIFETLPVPDDEESRSLICGRHGMGSAEHTCRQFGVRYLQGEGQMAEFIASRDCVLLDIKTTITT